MSKEVDTTPTGAQVLSATEEQVAAECPALTKTSDGKAIVPTELKSTASEIAHLVSMSRDSSLSSFERGQAAQKASDKHAAIGVGVRLPIDQTLMDGTEGLGSAMRIVL
ncbi:uncharacterized protein SPPG_07740 [Spizellomyces punctatus DAOM BR117]|uniref:Uncharacterized protein n=1 Tax=Spizellomyces punctatus (strain DAOM BR117) TaxID=645134 RepID=A0A0L0H7H0_SPIPD|nr:uncharacterized protein SPPG_07740 [Spizellomyces punctatus DAOM BR117]KNC96914.1 hypothetical protein SPPG_07740 [Spizellomyces punctatus DAOM BR117]|eukprot:XP_016604954.1 hypothetical protein SPPG_07740 [Spizellomyces punctatus DAOM BR117]